MYSIIDAGTNAASAAGQEQNVAMDGKIMVVGKPQDYYVGLAYGLAEVHDAATGALLHTITNPTPAGLDFFGSSVAISGTRIVVGAIGDDTGATDAGSVYVYDLASAWPTVPVATLNNPRPAQCDWFGWSVAISGTRIVVGAPLVGHSDAGASYVYDLASPTPTVPVAILTNPASRGRFGFSVGISDKRVVVGAPSHHNGAVDTGGAYVYNTGRAYLYDLASAAPTVPVAALNHPIPTTSEGFGWSVAISEGRVVVRAYREEPGDLALDRAHVYGLASALANVPALTQARPSQAADALFGNSMAMDGASFVVGVPIEDPGGTDRDAARVFSLVPRLKIVPGAPGFATLSWIPATASGFVLQYTDSLVPTNWLNSPSGAANPVTVTATNASRFYRLFQQ